MSIGTKLATAAEAGLKDALKKRAPKAGQAAVKTAAKTIAKDTSSVVGKELSPAVAGLVTLAKAAAGAGNKEAAQKSFVSAAQAAQGTLAGTKEGLAEVLRVAQIAHHTPESGEAAKLILMGAKDKFTDFSSKLAIADSAATLGNKPLQLALFEQMASHAPSTAEHLTLAGRLIELAKTDRAAKALIPTTLQGATARATTLAEIQAVQTAALTAGNMQAFERATVIGDRLIEQGHTGKGNFSQTIQDVLRELGVGR